MKPLPMLSRDQKLAEIKRLYYEASRPTIQRDLAKAIDLVKSMTGEEERERAAVYMDGLSQMRADWARQHNDGWRKGEGKGKRGQAGARKPRPTS
jgi:hypothetical protein